MALEPAFTVVRVGEAEIVKSWTTTTSVTDVVCVRLPLDPVIVKVYVPAGVALVVLTLRVELALPLAGGVTDVGLSVQVVFEGQPLTVRETAELNPFTDVRVAA